MPLGGDRPKPSRFDPQPKPCNKTRSVQHEKTRAVKMGFDTTPNSGASPFLSQKGDGQDESFVWQLKLTERGRMVLELKDIQEVVRQAALLNKHPAILMTLEGLPQNLPDEWVAVPSDLFKELIR